MTNNMRTTIAILLATIGLAKADIIPITIDIGPTRTFEGAQIIFDFDLNEPVGDGHKTFVISFANDQYIRLTELSTRTQGAAGFELGFQLEIPVFAEHGMFFGGFDFPLINYHGGFPLLIHGGTFDVELPTKEGALITGGQVVLTSNEFFGIGPHVPDSGSTIWLTLATLAGLAVLGRKQ